MTREVPIFFTVDDVYAPLLAVALNSAVKNSDPGRKYVAHVLHRGLSDGDGPLRLVKHQAHFVRALR